jgi:hypothetical protein
MSQRWIERSGPVCNRSKALSGEKREAAGLSYAAISCHHAAVRACCGTADVQWKFLYPVPNVKTGKIEVGFRVIWRLVHRLKIRAYPP